MKPNHHWALHIFEEIEDFGPVYSFWAFLSERLNKILKNLKSNNWTGGRVEVSMMRQFHRSTRLDSKVKFNCTSLLFGFIRVQQMRTLLLKTPEHSFEHQLVQSLIKHDEPTEALGTIQDAAQGGELAEIFEFGVKKIFIHSLQHLSVYVPGQLRNSQQGPKTSFVWACSDITISINDEYITPGKEVLLPDPTSWSPSSKPTTLLCWMVVESPLPPDQSGIRRRLRSSKSGLETNALQGRFAVYSLTARPVSETLPPHCW
jgi:hypothetical protein